MPSSPWITIDLTKEEDCDDTLDRCSNTPDYGMELDSDEEIFKGEALEWSCTLSSIPQGAKHQGKMRRLAHDEIKAELSRLHKDYMAHITSHSINDPALKELEEATWASYHLLWEDFGHALKQANTGVKFPKWLQWYLTAADPPMTITGCLQRPLSKSVPIKDDWYDICNMESPEFVKLHKQVLSTVFKEHTTSMRVVIKRMTTQARSSNVSLINVLPSTPVDTLDMIKGWQLNLHGVLPVIRKESDGTMNLHDVDIWMWLQKATPKNSSSVFRKSLWMLFQQSGRWCELASDQHDPPPIGDTFRASITKMYDWGDRHPRDHSEKELC
jgi:hypothetical protein